MMVLKIKPRASYFEHIVPKADFFFVYLSVFLLSSAEINTSLICYWLCTEINCFLWEKACLQILKKYGNILFFILHLTIFERIYLWTSNLNNFSYIFHIIIDCRSTVNSYQIVESTYSFLIINGHNLLPFSFNWI